MTHKLTIKDKKYLLVEFNKSQRKFEINKKKDISKDFYYLEGINFSSLFLSNNPSKIINTISNLTEEECKELVEGGYCSSNGMELFQDYLAEDNSFETAKESFISRLKSKNILAKSYCVEPNCKDFDDTRWDYQASWNKYQNLPDELLLIQINN